jgi:fibronectin type 3 domain-containing protein
VTGSTSRAVMLTWRAAAGASGYRVYLTNGGGLVHDSGSAATTASVALSHNFSGQVEVAAYNATGESPRSAPVTVQTPADSDSVPYAPRAVSPNDAVTSDSLWIAWEAVQTANAGYRVYIDGRFAASTTGPAHRVTGLAANRTYRVTVTAVTEHGESPQSRTAYGTTAL